MEIANDITSLVGNTPLVKLNRIRKYFNCYPEIIAKLESFNPSASVKDRIAFSMLCKAEEEGLITPNKTTLIEATSGNTGIALAMVAAAKGYKLILTMPDTMSIERRAMLRAYGAELQLTPGKEGMKGALDLANELSLSIANSYQFNQFENFANPDIHERTTAKEIWDQSNNNLDGLVTGVGTGGTITGCARFLKKVNPSCKIYAVEPKKSAVISGETAGSHSIQGIGAGFVPKVLNTNLIDEIIKINDDEAFHYGRLLARLEGLLSGISSGAALAATIKIGKRKELMNKRLIVILPSFGERYLSTAMFESNTSIQARKDGYL
ncbi:MULTISPECIES: cysteine synthase A [Prochlorococcus]|uniref:Cysteine synthase n=1 Tax=Prochlorococcus marinus str. MIT 9116 TaxID=167544 RepID=A0A0A1ZL01_PROMR|nr:cysteine synthase A [Prochlorococcus marinus]KGF89289.1 Cysteine synthase [Prochlorococcus marinus str. MIT 9107]KGF90045.1 Cysteine synthase [Prochlorococcus marinus str. MIT 9116]KGF95481.1 Cysteine synthase [Prochlorococcus marinus str. MIT 9123]